MKQSLCQIAPRSARPFADDRHCDARKPAGHGLRAKKSPLWSVELAGAGNHPECELVQAQLAVTRLLEHPFPDSRIVGSFHFLTDERPANRLASEIRIESIGTTHEWTIEAFFCAKFIGERFGKVLAHALMNHNRLEHSRMTHTRIKLLVAGSALAVAVAFLAIAGVREGWVYFLPVDQYVDAGAQYGGQRVRLHGKVAEHDFVADRSMLIANFDLEGSRHSLHVQYAGVIPEMFDVGRDVVVEGRPDDAGVFHADTLLTKCASKYESGDGEAPHADPHTMARAAERPQ